MKIAIVGAGAMGMFVAREIARSEPRASLFIIDADLGRARQIAAILAAVASQHARCDARDVTGLATVLHGTEVVVNAAQYDVNLDVMRACLAARCHYLDLGGMFHMTQRQLALGEEFKQAGLTAILGIGAAPGMTNVMARLACDQLDTVEVIETAFAAAAPQAPSSPVFVPPYSIRTIMQEFCEESMQFLAGTHSAQPALAGRKSIQFAPPIGIVDCVYTLHSEPATLPAVFAAKGVREVTWRLGLPPALEDIIRAFASAGLGSTEPLTVGGASIAPVDFLAASIDRSIRSSAPTQRAFTEYGAIRVEAFGTRQNIPIRIAVECTREETGISPDVAGIMTGTPCALAALMLARGEAMLPGVHGAESVVPPGEMIRELRERRFVTVQTERRGL